MSKVAAIAAHAEEAPSSPIVSGIRLVTLRGTPAVLVHDETPDAVTDEATESIDYSAHRGFRLVTRSSLVRAAKKAHPGLPVYGLWQTVLESKAVDLAQYDVLTLDPADEHDTGAYCTLRAGVPGVADVFFPDLPTAIESRRRLRISDALLSTMPPPSEPILIAEESAAIRRKQDRIAGILGGGMIACIVVLAFAINSMLAMHAKSLQAQADGLNAQAQALQSQNIAKMRTVDPRTERTRLRTRASLTRFIEILSRLEGGQIDTPVDFTNARDVTVVAKKLPTQLSFPTVATITPGTPLAVTFNLDGSALPAGLSAAGVTP